MTTRRSYGRSRRPVAEDPLPGALEVSADLAESGVGRSDQRRVELQVPQSLFRRMAIAKADLHVTYSKMAIEAIHQWLLDRGY